MALERWLASAILLITLAIGAAEGDVVVIGQDAPDFSATATDGSAVKLGDYKGKVVLLGLFATWCSGCIAEMPRIESEIYQKHKDAGLVVVMAGRDASISELSSFKSSRGLSFTMVVDSGRGIYSKYATSYIPRCYLIGRDGRVKFAMTGTSESDFSEMHRVLVEELGRTDREVGKPIDATDRIPRK